MRKSDRYFFEIPVLSLHYRELYRGHGRGKAAIPETLRSKSSILRESRTCLRPRAIVPLAIQRGRRPDPPPHIGYTELEALRKRSLFRGRYIDLRGQLLPQDRSREDGNKMRYLWPKRNFLKDLRIASGCAGSFLARSFKPRRFFLFN